MRTTRYTIEVNHNVKHSVQFEPTYTSFMSAISQLGILLSQDTFSIYSDDVLEVLVYSYAKSPSMDRIFIHCEETGELIATFDSFGSLFSSDHIFFT